MRYAGKKLIHCQLKNPCFQSRNLRNSNCKNELKFAIMNHALIEDEPGEVRMQENSTGKQILRQMRFELIEVLIVVAIIGLLTSIAIPLYSHYVGSTSNSTDQSGKKTTQTSLARYSVEEGSFYSQGGRPTETDTLALGIEPSGRVIIASTRSNQF